MRSVQRIRFHYPPAASYQIRMIPSGWRIWASLMGRAGLAIRHPLRSSGCRISHSNRPDRRKDRPGSAARKSVVGFGARLPPPSPAAPCRPLTTLSELPHRRGAGEITASTRSASVGPAFRAVNNLLQRRGKRHAVLLQEKSRAEQRADVPVRNWAAENLRVPHLIDE